MGDGLPYELRLPVFKPSEMGNFGIYLPRHHIFINIFPEIEELVNVTSFLR